MNQLFILASVVLAQAEGGGGAAAPGGQAVPAGGSMFSMLPLMGLLVLLFYFMILRPQKSEQGKRATMLAGLKKTDRVVTVGGLYGVVMNVDREADEVTLKVDESTNTKLRVTLGAIARVVEDKASPSAASNS